MRLFLIKNGAFIVFVYNVFVIIYVLLIKLDFKSKTEINLGLDLEFKSIHFGIEINKNLKFLTPKTFLCLKNLRKIFLKKFQKKSEIFGPKEFWVSKRVYEINTQIKGIFTQTLYTFLKQ